MIPALLLAPVAPIVARATARRVARPGWRAPIPVICCGNVTVGGAGKTTVALAIGRMLAARGLAVHFLSRGYGGRASLAHRVGAGDSAELVGDEALLLAAVAPTWIGPDRSVTARAAIAAGADVLVMDDGLQNPTLEKDCSLLVVDGAFGFGNGRVLPAGPLREPALAGAARSHAAILIGEDTAGASAALAGVLPILRAKLTPAADGTALAGRPVLAFAGIAHPDKFFATVEATGATLAARIAFPDHHPYSPRELRRLLDRAAQLEALTVTTAKDFVRIPVPFRDSVRSVGIELVWEGAAEVERLLTHVLSVAKR
jgi:tetraacyldisaccharide 4'-kinase